MHTGAPNRQVPGGRKGRFAHEEAAASQSRGQKGAFCTRETTAGRSRGHRGPFCTREAFEKADKAPSGPLLERQRVFRRKRGISPAARAFSLGLREQSECGRNQRLLFVSAQGFTSATRLTLLHTNKNAALACGARSDCIARRKRDSNPRNVAVQQFSRLPPSTTRPFLQSGLQI